MRSPTERERSIFSFQTIADFVLILLGHALGLDHHAALLIFRTNLLKQAKTEGFFQQRELRKTDTAREVCVGMAAQIDVNVVAVCLLVVAGCCRCCSQHYSHGYCDVLAVLNQPK